MDGAGVDEEEVYVGGVNCCAEGGGALPEDVFGCGFWVGGAFGVGRSDGVVVGVGFPDEIPMEISISA